jgi:hypothetical protein
MTEQELASLAPLDALRRLRLQVDNAISYVEHGIPLVEDHNLGRGKDQRLLWEIGDFVIMARFAGSNPPSDSLPAPPGVVCSNLLACPFCGQPPRLKMGKVKCVNDQCKVQPKTKAWYAKGYDQNAIDDWNSMQKPNR